MIDEGRASISFGMLDCSNTLSLWRRLSVWMKPECYSLDKVEKLVRSRADHLQ